MPRMNYRGSESMSNVSFQADSLSSRTMRIFLLLQIAGLFVVVALCRLERFFLALGLSLLTLLAFAAVLLWLHTRFQELPMVRERRELQRLQRRFQQAVQADEQVIRASLQQRQELSQAEHAELHSGSETLPNEQIESIRQKYQVLHARNDAAEGRALSSKRLLEFELTSFETRLGQLAPLTFPGYLSSSLASHGALAALLGCLLVLTQVASSVSAAASTAASLLAAYPTPSAAPLPTETPPPTLTVTATRTPSPTNTIPATASASPSQTSTPVPSATAAATLTPLLLLQPTNTSLIPISGDCDPAYPGVCIPPAPPDLDCGDVSYRRFQVLPPDPHGFDGDADGVGCEG
jgi:hypothetical protein